MGQKIHPTGFRMGKFKNWKSIWYSNPKGFADQMLVDLQAREYLDRTLKSAGMADCIIKRSFNDIVIDVHVARPGVVIGRSGKGIEELKAKLNEIFHSKVQVNVHDIKTPNLSSRLVAQNIIDGIERRIAPRFLINREIEKIKEAGALGAKIWVSGRIGGTLIHRTEKREFGSVPLQTLRANIDYYQGKALLTSAGLLGVKVWIYKGEIKDKNLDN